VREFRLRGITKSKSRPQFAAGGPISKRIRELSRKKLKSSGCPSSCLVVFGRRQLDTASCIDAAVR